MDQTRLLIVFVVGVLGCTFWAWEMRAAAVSEEGLAKYFAAVGSEMGMEAKLDKIAECFTLDAKLIAKDGKVFEGREGVREFYSSPQSPVLRPGFLPVPDKETMSFSPDGKTIAVEIQLTSPDGVVFVGDWFSFNSVGLITRLRIYQTSSESSEASE